MCYRGRRRPSFVFAIFKVGRFQKCPQTQIRGVSRINASTSASSTNISPNLEQLVTPLINKDEQDSSEYIYSEDEQEEDAEDNLKEAKVLTDDEDGSETNQSVFGMDIQEENEEI